MIFFPCQIHYTARFPDGTVFDSSYKRGRPLTMRIGAGKVRIVHSLQNTVHCSLRAGIV
jgi:FKBP-type peptidyl-prolyl cis-trans isomerase